MNNNESVVFNGLSNLLRTNVLGPIVNYLGATKNCQVTVEELATVLKLNSIATAPQMPGFTPQLNFGGAPPIGFPPVNNTLQSFGGVPMPLASTTKAGRTAKAPENVPENEKCQYKMTRGRNKDQRCQSRAEAGNIFCKLCKEKKSAATQQAQNGGAPTQGLVPTAPTFPGLPGMLPSNFPTFAPTVMNQLNPSMANVLEQPNKFKIRGSQLGDGLIHELDHDLLIRAIGQNNYICLGIYDPKTKESRPLTPEKIALCKSINMNYVDPTSYNVTGQSLPTITQQMPTVMTSGIPNFGLPQVPSLNMMGNNVAVTEIRHADDPAYGEDDDEGSDEE